MRTNTNNSKYVRVGEFAMRRVADDMILVPIRGRAADLSDIFQLNEVAAFVWNALESPASVDDLIRDVIGAFEVDEAQARKDVTELLEAFGEAELAKAEGAGT